MNRHKESTVSSFAEILWELYRSMRAHKFLGDNQPPTILFGHSFGGILAYELTLLLQRMDALPIRHLIVSATNNPDVLTARTQGRDPLMTVKISDLDDDELLAAMIGFGGSGGVDAEVIRASTDILRADWTALETYERKELLPQIENLRVKNNLPLCPLTIWAAADDPANVSQESSQGWSRYCSSPDTYSIHFFSSGGHFYLFDEEWKQQVEETLGKICLAPDAASSSLHTFPAPLPTPS